MTLRLDLEREEGHEFGPCCFPEPHDPGVEAAPGGGELDEAFLGRCLGGGGVDGAEVLGDPVPVLAPGEAERVADEVQHTDS